MTPQSKNFYLFLGFHSFLLGLFPFFLPVYLFKQGALLEEISWFIVLTGLGFCLTLWLFDRFRTSSYLAPLAVSFLLEICLLILLVLHAPLEIIAVVNGGYSCLYWTIQRLLFFAGGSSEDTGRRFGNFQIYVLIVLKLGVFIGGVLLENIGIVSVCLLSVAVGISGVGIFSHRKSELDFPVQMQKQRLLSFRSIVRFSDKYNSRFVFAIDGIFLYLESYFWLISLFFVVGESFIRLGLLVIGLALFLGLLFYLIKNRIDHMNNQKVYIAAVLLYMVSWWMRGILQPDLEYTVQLSLLLLVAFCTSFFRLAFNKRFFNTAQKSSRYHYLFIKSYYSQFFLALGFSIIGFFAHIIADTTTVLRVCYWAGSVAAIGYFFYVSAETKG